MGSPWQGAQRQIHPIKWPARSRSDVTFHDIGNGPMRAPALLFFRHKTVRTPQGKGGLG